jgi:aminoglycoside 6-adenylyltransferase
MDILSRILDWANNTDSVRVVLLVGSRAQGKKVDKFSDFDLSIFGHNFEFIRDDQWLKKISDPVICIHDEFSWEDQVIPTRLTIFDDLTKVDFSFHPMGLLNEMVQTKLLKPAYGNGYTILIDKEGIGPRIPNPDMHAYEMKKPEEREFQLAIREFWFEAYHVVKYLARKDLWAAKSRDWATKSWLLRMMQWNSVGLSGPGLQLKSEGRDMQNWLPAEIYDELKKCFCGLNLHEQWSGLISTSNLFCKLSQDTAKLFGFPYDHNPEIKLLQFISQLNPAGNEG